MWSAGSWRASATHVALVLALGCGHWAQGVLAQQHPSTTRDGLESIQIRPNVHVIFGAGGNVTVHVGDDGLVVVAPGDESAFLAPLPITRLWGVGQRTADSLASYGVRTIGDLVGWLKQRGEEYAYAFENANVIRAAIDRNHVKPDAQIAGAREIAFFPPMTGG